MRTIQDLQAIRETYQIAMKHWDIFNYEATRPSNVIARVHSLNQGQIYAINILGKILTDNEILPKLDLIPDECTKLQIAELYGIDPQKL